ncbi:DNA mismatch repair protein MutS [Methylobacterium sp. Leaf113]|uniref:Smr/MutS family protein n=1 Tax=Methylobacterium sp. Leaf113 TaxID=1736259 RepID=UPI0006F7EB9F|nr:Smr/MutS family protein [Methylobacterium sp. Leaf113]KQP77573.1 DNA mismatch repair protein MutS [Methylobacterium sp. Leaf113]
MKTPRRPRGLSSEDAYLWGEIARLITPLRGRGPGRPKAANAADATGMGTPVAAKPPAMKAAAKAASATSEPPKPAPPKPMPPKPMPRTLAKRAALKPSPPPAAPAPVIAPSPAPAPGLERRVRLALRRGALQVDARIDLHGMYQAQAHGALIGFLMRARASGHTHVLVVTGKGGPTYDDAFSERGVLRRSVPHWLRAPDLRHVVLGFEEAARHHGGAGALYVRLRRR